MLTMIHGSGHQKIEGLRPGAPSSIVTVKDAVTGDILYTQAPTGQILTIFVKRKVKVKNDNIRLKTRWSTYTKSQ